MKTAVWTLRMTREESISKFILYIFEKSTASTHTTDGLLPKYSFFFFFWLVFVLLLACYYYKQRTSYATLSTHILSQNGEERGE
jgi:hypothetical protein